VELVRPIERSLEIAARNFHPAELAAIRASTDAPEIFLRCWTRKEAVLKAIGTGIAYPLDAFDVRPRSADDSQIELPADNGHSARCCWLRDENPSSEYIAAVATTAATSEAARYCFLA
jgi:phosphopantetheine--protein transferase-like protein